ncbi:MAG: FAD-dependent oxidoreductase [Myxococcota bacterium]|nr:FAD-dependent oxidoreductase [Myxococcota bacterium]
MARSPLFALLRRTARLALAASREGLSAEDAVQRWDARTALGRRDWITGLVGAGVASALPSVGCGDDGPRPPALRRDARIAIVGAGVSGLTCAYRLQQAGVVATLFDSWNRIGGRMFTARGMWADDQLVELGGELIDTGHMALRSLAAELGLELDPILEAPGSGITQDSFFFQGRFVREAEIVEAFRPLAERMQADLAREGDPEHFDRIDRTSIAQYLDAMGGVDPVLRAILDVAYTGEYGREIDEQSSWNLLWLIDSARPEPFRIFGDSDEAFHVRGGNDQIPTRLAERFMGEIALEHRLVRVRELGTGAFRLSFDRGGGSSREEDFDAVVFAMPFTRLREVEFEPPLPAEKRQIVDQLGVGTNAKLMLQFTMRRWRTEHRSSGSAFTDNGLQTLWETSRGQPGASGILTVFAGGRIGERIGEGTAEERALERLPWIDQLFPGTAADYRSGSAVRMHWPTVEHVRGSYACYLPGQARWSGLEGQRVGHLHFCGEHTSVDFQGYMNGAIETGERAAAEILGDMGRR